MTAQLQLIEGFRTERPAGSRRRTPRPSRFTLDRRTRERGLAGIAAARAVLADVAPPASWLESKAS
jgi:hypothetical protein